MSPRTNARASRSVKMLLKRKRSDDQLSPFASSSPLRINTAAGNVATMDTDLDVDMDMDMDVDTDMDRNMNVDIDSPLSAMTIRSPSRSCTPSHLPSRTFKRLRNGRPSDHEVHQNTLQMLYRAQQRAHQPQHVLSPPTTTSPAALPSPPTASLQPHSPPAPAQNQRSLHSFWNIPSKPQPPPPLGILSPAPAPSVDAIVDRPTSCDDCGVDLGGEEAAVDDGYGFETYISSCSLCCKAVCFSCSVSNLGEQRRCLVCAGKQDTGKRWVGGAGLASEPIISHQHTPSAMPQQGTRDATHAGSWYEGRPDVLSRQLDGFLEKVPATVDGKQLPIPKSRVIIAPHAGYSYSGPCAAWAYKSLDLSSAKRIFVLGPSHTYYLKGCALTTFASYETPFGNLAVDTEVVEALRETGKFSDIPASSDEDEHSLEMHLPYIWKRLEQTHGDASPDGFPPIVPILIGDNNGAKEKEFGQLLAKYLQDPSNAFVVSSDFCHWGPRFSYTAYVPSADRIDQLRVLSRRAADTETPIHEGIKILDELAMEAVASGKHDSFVENLTITKNTVCGRHPIGVTMAALEAVGAGPFRLLRYERSSLVERLEDSSVSYASFYAVA
ncbi:hypothetical protein N8I77_012719 [Diaporthe amygdali]|uniref:Protein MEMO1 n=1 Tax=Phomopsis amygdali TaxID=1214568 RepID=A0AAD9S4E5_PHOAM|nr:hypothetical protein N8I77_012719 [Diaporthe amygdali]